MAQIVVKNMNNKVINTNETKSSILSIFHDNSIDWMHACGAKGRCTTCKMIVMSGIENLSIPNEYENRYKNLGQLKPNERLACQCTLNGGEVEVVVPELCKLPHIKYSG